MFQALLNYGICIVSFKLDTTSRRWVFFKKNFFFIEEGAGYSFNDFLNLWLPKGTGGDGEGLGVWDWHMHTEVYGMIGQ